MRPKDLFLPGLVVVLIYIAWGAAIPGPIGGFSQSLRSGANSWLSSLFSGFETFNPHDRTQREVDRLEPKP